MNKIKIMDEVLANKIAAGEVVERIANVVKELVENSIDACSKNIKVELVEAGTKEIKVIDDGCGMSKEDARLSFSRHATSKIKNENDLYFINTLGFRGEALAAISSVSLVSLDTFDGDTSTYILIEGGKIKNEKVGSKRKGTVITVSKLFYNTPARLKFLKSLNTELSLCSLVIERIALSHPDVSFTLINDNKELIKTSGSNDLYKTIHEIFGYSVSKNMLEVKGENYDYIINGYISNINISKSSKNSMITLVNGRVVNNINVNRTIKDAYHTILAENKFPIVVINIEVDPTMVDVNIHPTKQDIKFSKIDSLEELLFDIIRNKLNESDNTYKGYSEKRETYSDYSDFNMSDNNYMINESETSYKSEVNYKTEASDFNNKVYESLRLSFSNNSNVELEKTLEDNLVKPVGLALGTYLIAQDEDVMYMIDIHAANERINFEIYLDALKNNKTYTTRTLFPIQIEFPKNEYLIIKENIDVLKDLGFKVEEFGINTFRIYEHPSWLKEGYEEESIRMILDLLCEFKDKFDRVKFSDRTAMNLACKMSVKANTNIGLYEQEELINRLFKCEFPYTCPHGRPTIIKYPKSELEKLFKRTN